MGSIEKTPKIIVQSKDRPPLDRWRADQLLEPNRKIWGLTAIAGFIGLSTDTTRELAQEPGVPIYRPSGRYFAFSAELVAWLRSK
jgi:hypothetical protein